MNKNLNLAQFSLIQRLKRSKNVLQGIVVSMSVLSSPQLFGQCVAPVVSPTTICAGNLAQLTPTNSNPGGTLYDWYSTSTGGTPLYTGNIYTPQLSSTTTLYVASRGTGCPTTRTAVTVTVNPAPTGTMTLLGGSAACVGDQVNVQITDGNSVATGSGWVSQPPLTVIPPGGTGFQGGHIEFYAAVSSGTFTYSFVTSAGCTKSVSTYLTVAPALATPTMTSVTSVCQGVSLPLAPSMTGGTWTISPSTGATISGNAFTGTTAGVYAVTYTVSNAGCSKYVTSNITVNPTPVATLTVNAPTTVCAGSRVSITGGSTGNHYVTSTNPPGAVFYGGAGSIASFGESWTVSTSGTFTRTTATAAGCATTVTANVTVNPLPTSTISVAKTSICQDLSGQNPLQLSATNSGGTGAWSISTNPLPALTSGATQNSSISQTGAFTGYNPGIFNVRYTVTQTLNGISCSAFTEKQITVGALPFTITGPAGICIDGSGNYAVQQVQAGGAGNNVYGWYVYQSGNANPPLPVDRAGISNFNQTLATLSANSTSASSVKLTAIGTFYCIAGDPSVTKTSSASLDVNIVAKPSGIRLKCADATCTNLIAVMKDGSSTAGLTFTWNGSATGATFANPKSGSYVYCLVTNSTGCSNYFYWYPLPTTTDACGRQLYDYTKAQYCEQNYTLTTYPSCASGASYNLRTENSDTYQLKVYPNPATNKISFVSDGSAGSATIYDVDGIALKTQPLTEGRTMYDIDVTSIPSGMYFLHVPSSSGNVYTAPLIKE